MKGNHRNVILFAVIAFLGAVAVVMASLVVRRESSSGVQVFSSGYSNSEFLVIDTDVGLDDFLAISMILQNALLQYNLIGITTVQGIQSINESSTNIARYFNGAGYPSYTYVGASTPIDGHPFPSSIDYRDRSDLIFNFPVCDIECKNTIKNVSAQSFLISAAKKHPQKLTILSIGPLTNIANAIQQDKDFATNVKQVFVMGGAVKVAGNVQGHNTSEWNFYADPLAAKVVIDSGIAVTLVPLDVIEYITCENSFMNELNQINNSSLSFAGKVIKSGIFWICDNWVTKQFYDMIAALVVVDRGLFEFQNFQLEVDPLEGSLSTGSGASVLVAMEIKNVSEVYKFVVNSVIKGF